TTTPTTTTTIPTTTTTTPTTTTTTPTTTTTTPTTTTKPNEISKKFIFGTAYLYWQDAEKACQAMGARLASIHSLEENNYLRGEVHKRGDWPFWIGGHKDGDIHPWKWIDGTQMSYTDPIKDGADPIRHHCLYYYRGEWRDALCWRKLLYICSIPKSN
uniref:C-type lectin domain-containing protein n=1 Tax=Clytia hemisphaerica TaxID=252671 RepID=A0A7M6DK83_9CNID